MSSPTTPRRSPQKAPATTPLRRAPGFPSTDAELEAALHNVDPYVADDLAKNGAYWTRADADPTLSPALQQRARVSCYWDPSPGSNVFQNGTLSSAHAPPAFLTYESPTDSPTKATPDNRPHTPSPTKPTKPKPIKGVHMAVESSIYDSPTKATSAKCPQTPSPTKPKPVKGVHIAVASPPSSSASQRVKSKPTSHFPFSAAAIQPETRIVKYGVRYKRVFKTLEEARHVVEEIGGELVVLEDDETVNNFLLS